MDSEDSLPGSSASSSSSNISENSRCSTPMPNNEDCKLISNTNEIIANDEDNKSLQICRRSTSSENVPRSARASPKSGSRSSSSSMSSSENEDDDVKSALSDNKSKSKASTDGSSSGESENDEESCKISSNGSPTRAKSRCSSKNSSSYSNNSRSRSRSYSKDMRTDHGAINVNHEDLSDVSDMESEKRVASLNNSKHLVSEEGTKISSSVEEPTDSQNSNQKQCTSSESPSKDAIITDLRQKLDKKKCQLKINSGIEMPKNETSNGNGHTAVVAETFEKPHDEDALDFEAEEGECQEPVNNYELGEKQQQDKNKSPEKSVGEAEDGEELEEGEVSDEDEKRPEETEPKPVCRFYTRGQCTWGMSCRFLHPGVTDKGNYTMFDLVRAVPVSQGAITGNRSGNSYVPHQADYHDFRSERPLMHHRATHHHHQPTAVFPSHTDSRAVLSSSLLPEAPVVVESAWERGLRTAKEMMRKANKRKEQDMDFEDKKMNLTLSPDELEKDPYYIKERETPPEVVPYIRQGPYQDVPSGMYSPERFGRSLPPSAYDEVDPYGRSTRYRELPPHRMPQYEDERRVRPTREVIVQRVEPIGRADEWNDPWMRSKSPGGHGSSRDVGDKRRRDRRSYSSNSSYSSSSSSQTDSSSETSRSESLPGQRRNYNSSAQKPPTDRTHTRKGRSSNSSPRRMKHSPYMRRSPVNKRRGHLSPSPSIGKESRYYNSGHKRNKLSPIAKKGNDKKKLKRMQPSSSSGTGSSDSSASDSESDSGSSSSDSSSRSIPRTPHKRLNVLDKASNNERKIAKKEPQKKREPISIELKKVVTVGASALSSPTNSNSSEKDSKKTRREELLKQLRAVEDAIAKKRSKLT